MADQQKFTIEHPNEATLEVHEIDVPEHGDIIEFEYKDAAHGGPVYTPRHMPAGG
jgi:hypothetical protein